VNKTIRLCHIMHLFYTVKCAILPQKAQMHQNGFARFRPDGEQCCNYWNGQYYL